ncbi:MAG TPA: S53 family peptidase [Gemmataceae bacterium]|nr:S53 family peptidase [Gemmataceae bacterium]
MLSAVGGVGSGDLRALYALNLPFAQRLAVIQAQRNAVPVSAGGAIGTDNYTPSVPSAAPALTYNRFGQMGAAAGYTPAQVAQAYGFNQTGLTGAGQTIAIVTADNSPTVAQDLSVFDSTFGLPTPNLQIVNQTGGAPSGPSDSGWALETALDVEWAHATAPQANILLVEANSASVSDLTTAINYARYQPGVSVVSMSFGTAEFPQELRYDSILTTPPGHSGITFVAASGDSGAGTLWPAVSPNVLSVGGTMLLTGPAGTYAGEIGWSGSGGGVSLYESEPAYQQGVQSTGRRTTPDVAFDAAPQTGVQVYQGGTWQAVGGTSAGAPQWAGLIAQADQQRAQVGLGPLNQAQAQLYNLPASDFHDVVLGSNGYLASPGYDYVTGLGSPVANRLIAGLSSPVAPPSVRLPFNLQPVSVASLLFPWMGSVGGIGWGWGGFGSIFPGGWT